MNLIFISIKIDITYLVNLKNCANVVNKTNTEDSTDALNQEKKETNRRIMTVKNPILKINSNPEKATETENPRFQPKLESELDKRSSASSRLSLETEKSIRSSIKQTNSLQKKINQNITKSDDTSSKKLEKTNQVKEVSEITAPRANLAMLRQQKKNEMKKAEGFKNSLSLSEEAVGKNKSIETIIENSRRSGQLNLSDKNLNEGI